MLSFFDTVRPQTNKAQVKQVPGTQPAGVVQLAPIDKG